jgi:NAD(P)-dependent dehydrogenase (short-subunit alcohol dehydrogenase family)
MIKLRKNILELYCNIRLPRKENSVRTVLGKLSGKVAIITGCGRGFGEVIARVFAGEGSKLCLCDVIPSTELEHKVGSQLSALGTNVMCLQVDVSIEEQVEQMVHKVLRELGTVDILVNNVGIAGPTKDCWQITLPEWNRTISVNLGGAFLCSRAVLPEMIRRKWGRIINMSSITGKTPLPHRTPYATSKMGMIGFTRSLAAEVGRYNITVNSICPGSVRGERNTELARDFAEYRKKSFNVEEYQKRVDEMSSRGVMAGQYLGEEGFTQAFITHEDVAYMALFLASDEARHITGEDINVCAGESIG